MIRAYLNQIELVSPGVREMVLELVRFNVKYNAGSLLSQDIALAFRVAAKADPSLLKHVIPLA